MGVVAPSLARAQLTLVVRDSAELHAGVEAAMEDALRDAVGGSVRRVDSPLDELALVAGCATASASDALCVATIARAANARLVAIEHVSRDGSGWSASIDLRRADGTQVSVLRARCDDASCVSTLEGDDPEPVVVVAHEAPRVHEAETSSVLVTSPTPAAEPTGPPRAIAIVPGSLFASAVLLGVGSLVAGTVSGVAASDAAHLGMLRNAAQVDHERALEDQSMVALGVGIALASCGAGLAIAGALTLGGQDGPRLRIGVLDVGLTVSF